MGGELIVLCRVGRRRMCFCRSLFSVPNRQNTLSGMQMKRNVHEVCREVAKLVTGLFCLLVIGQWFQLLFSFPLSFVYI